MAEKDNQQTREDGQQNVNQQRGKAGGNMEENLDQMMEQVEEPQGEEKDYDTLSDWVADTIKDPQPPTEAQLPQLEALFEAQKADLPEDLKASSDILQVFFSNAKALLKIGDREGLSVEIETLSAQLYEEMFKGEVDLLEMLKDFEKMEGL